MARIITVNRGQARKTAERTSSLFYEATVADLSAARFLVRRIGQLPIDYQGLIHVTGEDLWIHHPCLADERDVRVSQGRLLEEEDHTDDSIELTEIGPLFSQ